MSLYSIASLSVTPRQHPCAPESVEVCTACAGTGFSAAEQQGKSNGVYDRRSKKNNRLDGGKRKHERKQTGTEEEKRGERTEVVGPENRSRIEHDGRGAEDRNSCWKTAVVSEL